MIIFEIYLYSQTGCSFADSFATFRRHVGILIDSLLGATFASCCESYFYFLLIEAPTSRYGLELKIDFKKLSLEETHV